MSIQYSVLKLFFYSVCNRMNYMDIQMDNHSEFFFYHWKFKSSENIKIFWSSYLTWAQIILFFEQSNTWFFARFIVFAINDALAKIDTFLLHAFLQIIFILRRRIFTTNANGIRAIITTIRAVDITWTILKIRYLSKNLDILTVNAIS